MTMAEHTNGDRDEIPLVCLKIGVLTTKLYHFLGTMQQQKRDYTGWSDAERQEYQQIQDELAHTFDEYRATIINMYRNV